VEYIPFHFSDGEDFDAMKTVASAKRLLDLGVNMLGYGEIQIDPYNASRLMDTFASELHLDKRRVDASNFEIIFGRDQTVPFVGAVLKEKSHVYLTLREFLRKEEGF
jgi:uncharacterized sporulation protein YeaH/YhbH (DUF444 family)